MANRQITLAQRPTGMVDQSTTSLIDSPMPVCGPDEALIKVGLLSIDPTIRTWMNDAPGYLPPIGIGDVFRSGGSGVVVESNSERYHVGDVVNGMTGWQEWAIASESNKFTVLPKGLGLDLATVMNVLGATGLTAYFGLLDVGAFKEGDVVVVSGAAGATGSVVGQIARARGAGKVVGIAGGEEKCSEAWRNTASTSVSTIAKRDSPNASARPARRASICTSTMSVATFSTRRWRTLRCTRAS